MQCAHPTALSGRSGVNALGYYMYHGGNNPHPLYSNDDPEHTMQESSFQPAGAANPMPSFSYDFFAPVGEFGQVRRRTRLPRCTAGSARSLTKPVVVVVAAFRLGPTTTKCGNCIYSCAALAALLPTVASACPQLYPATHRTPLQHDGACERTGDEVLFSSTTTAACKPWRPKATAALA